MMRRLKYLMMAGLAWVPAALPIYQISYIENRDGAVREIKTEGRNEGAPWRLRGLPPLEESVMIAIDSLPELPLKRKFELKKEEILLGEKIVQYHMTLDLEAKAEVISLNEEETALTKILEPFGIESIDLKGEGSLWIKAEDQSVVAEDFFLSGFVIRDSKKENWRIEWARGTDSW